MTISVVAVSRLSSSSDPSCVALLTERDSGTAVRTAMEAFAGGPGCSSPSRIGRAARLCDTSNGSGVAVEPSILWTPTDAPATPEGIRLLRGIKGQMLRREIPVTMERDEDLFIAANRTLRMWGTGYTESEALADFCQGFLDVLGDYTNTPDERLTRDAIEHRDFLRSYLS